MEAIEWSFDALFSHRSIPQWFIDLIALYGKEGRLVGHGVYYSLFSGAWKPAQEEWLDQLKETRKSFDFAHISEHFGFMTGEDFHKGAPLSVPFNQSTIRLAHDRLCRLADAAACPVGLENLAFAYSLEDIRFHGDFLETLVSAVNGFIILDLHNLYCQVKNFEVPFEKIIELYPLDLVREVHISGGSWEPSMTDNSKKIRRDTHDEAVPKEVFEYLEAVLPRIPNVQFVMLEHMGFALKKPEEKNQFRRDFMHMKEIVSQSKREHSVKRDFTPKITTPLAAPYEDLLLAKQQSLLSKILEESRSLEEVRTRLQYSSLADSDWRIEQWEDCMIETAYQISQKWKAGF